MAQTILSHSAAPAPQSADTQYKLPEGDRQKILAQSDSARRMQTIEKQRQNFIQKNGHDGVSSSQ